MQLLGADLSRLTSVLLCWLQISVGSHRFTYDNVYGSGGADDASSLYLHCVQPLVDGLFKGYNATVFAYGESGSCCTSAKHCIASQRGTQTGHVAAHCCCCWHCTCACVACHQVPAMVS